MIVFRCERRGCQSGVVQEAPELIASYGVVATARGGLLTYGGAAEREVGSRGEDAGRPATSRLYGPAPPPPRPMIMGSRAGSIAERGRRGARADPGGRAVRYRSMV